MAKGMSGVSGGLFSIGGSIDKSLLKKLIWAFFVIAFLLILVFVGITLFRRLNGNGNGGSLSNLSPSPGAYHPHKPSVWADDKEVLSIEEDLSVLEKEISRANVREVIPKLPSLDFNVSF